jgi:hypothetical protein
MLQAASSSGASSFTLVSRMGKAGRKARAKVDALCESTRPADAEAVIAREPALQDPLAEPG